MVVKAKKFAEQKLLEKDIAGAKKIALKAQNMFPGVDGFLSSWRWWLFMMLMRRRLMLKWIFTGSFL